MTAETIPAEVLDECWRDLVEKTDRTSPEDYPDMALITREELGAYLALADRSTRPAEPAPEVEDTRCVCQGCDRRYSGDLLVPDDVWARIKPEGKPDGAGLLCAACIVDRAVEAGIWTSARAASGDAPEVEVSMLRKLAEAAQKVAPGPWEAEGEETESGWGKHDEFVILDAEGRRLCGTENADTTFGSISEETDGDGGHYQWNEPSRVLMHFIAACDPSAVLALLFTLEAERAKTASAQALVTSSEQERYRSCAALLIRAETAEAPLSRALQDRDKAVRVAVEDERDRLLAEVVKPHGGLVVMDARTDAWAGTTRFWLEDIGAMLPADRARLRADQRAGDGGEA